MFQTDRLLEGVKCPYCKAGSDNIEVGQTTATMLSELRQIPPTYDPNTYTTEYKCLKCGKRFYIDRKVQLTEEFVFDEQGKIRRVRF